MNVQVPGNHIDQLLRQTRMHHVQLSSMADLKANIVLTMSSVIITLSVPQAFKPEYRWPFLVLILFCLITVGLAAYSVMPKLRLWRRPLVPADPKSREFDLLFFGDFTRLSYQEFADEMEAVMNDPSRTYEVQVREIYALGEYLAKKKYRFLRLAYLTFGAGLAASVMVLLLMLASAA